MASSAALRSDPASPICLRSGLKSGCLRVILISSILFLASLGRCHFKKQPVRSGLALDGSEVEERVRSRRTARRCCDATRRPPCGASSVRARSCPDTCRRPRRVRTQASPMIIFRKEYRDAEASRVGDFHLAALGGSPVAVEARFIRHRKELSTHGEHDCLITYRCREAEGVKRTEDEHIGLF